jgi:hypothetical protein
VITTRPVLDRGVNSCLTCLSEGKLLKERPLRKVLLSVGLSIMAVLVLAPMALAQPNGPAYNFLDVPNDVRPCPFDLDKVAEIYGPDIACGEGGGYVPATSDSASPTTSPTSSPTASPSATPTATASASTSTSAAGAAQYQYTSILPGTGGVVSDVGLLAIIPAILLVGGGLLSARLIRRS